MSQNTYDTHSPQYPVDIYERIIDSLWDDPPSLKACALTCRLWHPRSRYRLYNIYHQHIRSEYSRDIFMNMLRASPSLGPYIRSLSITRFTHDRHPHWTNSIPLQMAPMLPNLFKLHFRDVLSSAWMHPFMHSHLAFFKSVGNLSLEGCRFDTFNSLARIILSFPSLFYLTLNNVRCNDLNPVKHLVGRSRSKNLRIHSLAIITDSWCSRNVSNFIKWLMTTPSTTSISLFSFAPTSPSDLKFLETFLRATSQNLKHLEICFMYHGQSQLSEVTDYLRIDLCRTLTHLRFEDFRVDDLSDMLPVLTLLCPTIEEIWLWMKCKQQENVDAVEWDAFDGLFALPRFPNLLVVKLGFNLGDFYRFNGEKPDVTKVNSRLCNLISRGLLQNYESRLRWRDEF